MISKFKKQALNISLNAFGSRTQKKILVIESDDWGSIRTTNLNSFKVLANSGLPMHSCIFNKYDSLECDKDLEILFESLYSVKDINGNHVKFTVNNIVANPDFKKIKESEYEEYHLEPFTKTLNDYPNCNNVINLYNEGILNNIFRPQFHGREHLNTKNWMNSLKNKEKNTHLAFEQNMFTAHFSENTRCRGAFLDAFSIDSYTELNDLNNKIEEGLTIFESIWGFRPKSIIAPCYIWHSSMEFNLFQKGIKFIQGMLFQNSPILGQLGYKRKYHYLGQKGNSGIKYLIRNVNFEPSANSDIDVVNNCLAQIKMAFDWKKPAILSTHRVNFIGSIIPNNQSNNIRLFKLLLHQITKIWPDVEFMFSDELGEIL